MPHAATAKTVAVRLLQAVGGVRSRCVLVIDARCDQWVSVVLALPWHPWVCVAQVDSGPT